MTMNNLAGFWTAILSAIPTVIPGKGDESINGSLFSEVSVNFNHLKSGKS